jgi:hypothetical protein
MRIDHKDIVKINYWIGKFYEDIIKVVDQIEACIKILEHKVHEGILTFHVKKSIMNTVADQLQKLSIECYNQIIFL